MSGEDAEQLGALAAASAFREHSGSAGLLRAGAGRLRHILGALDSREPCPQSPVLAFQIRHAASRRHQVLGHPAQCSSDPHLSVTHGALTVAERARTCKQASTCARRRRPPQSAF